MFRLLTMPGPKHVLVLAAAVFLLMVLFPPYFGVYDQAGANLHMSLGLHPIWDPPSQAEAYRAIHGEPHDAMPAVSVAERSRVIEERLALTRVGFNKVMFVFQVVTLALAMAVAAVTLRLLSRRRAK